MRPSIASPSSRRRCHHPGVRLFCRKTATLPTACEQVVCVLSAQWRGYPRHGGQVRRQVADAGSGVPVLPGYHGTDQRLELLREQHC